MDIVIIITAHGCRTCDAFRNGGELGEDYAPNKAMTYLGSQWDSDLFYCLLTGHEQPTDKHQGEASPVKYKVYELHLASLRETSIHGAKSFTVFSLEEDEEECVAIHRQRFSPSKDQGKVDVSVDDSVPDTIDTSFGEVMRQYVPSKLTNYFLSFPCIMVFSEEEWTKGLKDAKYSPYGIVNGFGTVPLGNGFAIDSKSQKPTMPYVKWIASVDPKAKEETVSVIPLYNPPRYPKIYN